MEVKAVGKVFKDDILLGMFSLLKHQKNTLKMIIIVIITHNHSKQKCMCRIIHLQKYKARGNIENISSAYLIYSTIGSSLVDYDKYGLSQHCCLGLEPVRTRESCRVLILDRERTERTERTFRYLDLASNSSLEECLALDLRDFSS